MTDGPDTSDARLLEALADLKESVDQIDRSMRELLASEGREVPRPARDATRRHREAWKTYMEIRKERWG